MQHKARKRFGQNFLHDDNVINTIISSLAAKKNQYFVEIGPGLGALTFKLLPLITQLDVIEIDHDLAQHLQNIVPKESKLTVYNKDVLKFDFTQLQKHPLRIIGNLPYNISTPLIFHLLKFTAIVSDMTFMLQKEVAERITAAPNTSSYGRLSVMMQYYCTTDYLFTVPPTAFKPKPKVESAVAHLVPYQVKPFTAVDEIAFAKIVKLSFTHPRKTIANNLKGIINLEDLSISPQKRPGELTVQDYVNISNYFTQKL